MWRSTFAADTPFPGEFASLSCAPLLPGVTRLNFLRRVFEVNGDRSHVSQQICIYLSFAIEFHLLCKFIVKRKRFPLQVWKVVHMTLSLSGSVSPFLVNGGRLTLYVYPIKNNMFFPATSKDLLLQKQHNCEWPSFIYSPDPILTTNPICLCLFSKEKH